MVFSISKIYKFKDKLALYLPQSVIGKLGIKEGDEVEFLDYRDRYFIIAKKSDIVNLLTGEQTGAARQHATPDKPVPQVSAEELAVLKKLDTIKYTDRTKDRLSKDLSAAEKKTLHGLIKKRFVLPFKKQGEQQFRYSIPKDIYDALLMGKRPRVQDAQATEQRHPEPQTMQPTRRIKKWEASLNEGGASMDLLEQNGYLVVATEAEAGALSQSLEESIRHGTVIGTRAFNKKYYIAMKAFIAKNSPGVIKVIGTKKATVKEISDETGIDEDGIRAILYVLAEQGDVTEVKRDTFKAI